MQVPPRRAGPGHIPVFSAESAVRLPARAGASVRSYQAVTTASCTVLSEESSSSTQDTSTAKRVLLSHTQLLQTPKHPADSSAFLDSHKHFD